LTFIVLAACSTVPTNRTASSQSLSFEELKQRVARDRGLPFRKPLLLETLPNQELVELQKKRLKDQYADDKLRVLERVYKRLGLLPPNADWLGLMAEFRLLTNGAVYDPKENKIFVPRETWRHGSSMLRALRGTPPTETEAREFLLALALVQALEEQNFHLEERFLQSGAEDLKLAIGAIAGGETVLAALADSPGAKPAREKILAAARNYAGNLEIELRQFPPFLRRLGAFRIAQGSAFVSWAFSLKEWPGVNELLLHPPLSTKQILHPEKYYVAPEEPARIVPWALMRRLSSPAMIEETMGQFIIQALLAAYVSADEAARSAAGWAADTLLAVVKADELVLAWLTAWDNPEQAVEFNRSFRVAIEKRLNVGLKPFAEDQEVLTSWSDNGDNVLLQLRGNFVLYLDGIRRAQALEITQEFWQNLEREKLREPLPLELSAE
jgi:hypothetical protein